MSAIDWAKLVAQNRAKAYGIPWSEAEANAVYQLKIPADYVRKGILTLEDYEKAKGVLPPEKTREELAEEAKKLGIPVTPDATKESLEKVLTDKKTVVKKDLPNPKAKTITKKRARNKK
jgi:tRNA(Ile)-lysidine synthase TilS/MesJ